MKTKDIIGILSLLSLMISCSENNGEIGDVALSVSDFTITIDENVSNRESIGTIDASPNEGDLIFSIIDQNPNGAIEINSSTGEIMVLNEVLFDFESYPIITALIQVERRGNIDMGTITINLNDVVEFKTKLLKQTTSHNGHWRKYFYNEKKQLILTTQTSNEISLDSTYFEYNNDKLYRILQRTYVPTTGVVNSESIFLEYNSTKATGTTRIFLENGTIFQNQTFEYTFSENLIKTISFFNIDGIKLQDKIFTHDENGNLTQWNQIYYYLDGSIETNNQYLISKWDNSGLKTKKLFYWNNNIEFLQDIYLTNNNCLNLIQDDQTYNYSFEYDSDGNVVKYNHLDDERILTLEYYE